MFSIWFFLVLIVKSSHVLGDVEYQIESMGCHESKKSILSKLILSGRDSGSHAFYSPIDWKDYNNWLSDFICECVIRLLALKPMSEVEFIGIEYFGECWGNLVKNKEVKNKLSSLKASTSQNCVNGFYNETQSSCDVFTGVAHAMSLYKVTRKGKQCKQFFTAIGCRTNSKSTGMKLHIGKLENMKNIFCKCAEETKQSGNHYFQINNRMECMAWKHQEKKALAVSSSCLSDAKSRLNCVQPGSHKKQQYVPHDIRPNRDYSRIYQIHQGPLACQSNPCENDGKCFSSSPYHFNCVCKKGTYGRHCEKENDTCEMEDCE